ncbi:MAG: isoquinoline 1-oxidoreductase beta subunit [Myxococcota bacterium]
MAVPNWKKLGLWQISAESSTDDRVIALLEAGRFFSATTALYGNVTLKNGAVEQTRFRDYRLLRMPKCPRHIHTEIMTEGDAPRPSSRPGHRR